MYALTCVFTISTGTIFYNDWISSFELKMTTSYYHNSTINLNF